MNEVYAPIAEKGGWTGWGVMGVPHIQGMKSIDNHYLLVHLAWGRLGYILFLLIVWENIRVLLVRSWQFKALQDRAFVFSMLAAMAVLWFTLLTVYYGGTTATDFFSPDGLDTIDSRPKSKQKFLLPTGVHLTRSQRFTHGPATLAQRVSGFCCGALRTLRHHLSQFPPNSAM